MPIPLNFVTVGRIQQAYAKSGREGARRAIVDLIRRHPEPGDEFAPDAVIEIPDSVLDSVLDSVAALSAKPPIILNALIEKDGMHDH